MFVQNVFNVKYSKWHIIKMKQLYSMKWFGPEPDIIKKSDYKHFPVMLHWY